MRIRQGQTILNVILMSCGLDTPEKGSLPLGEEDYQGFEPLVLRSKLLALLRQWLTGKAQSECAWGFCERFMNFPGRLWLNQIKLQDVAMLIRT